MPKHSQKCIFLPRYFFENFLPQISFENHGAFSQRKGQKPKTLFLGSQNLFEKENRGALGQLFFVYNYCEKIKGRCTGQARLDAIIPPQKPVFWGGMLGQSN
jgi:hypothetical protein